MGWHDRIIYHRDFAYNRPRSRMAHGSVGDVPATTYAEYVFDSPARRPVDADAGESVVSHTLPQCTGEESHDAPQAHLARGPPPPPPSCPVPRPSLAHRLYSHRLHVRAKAKLLHDRLLSGPMISVHVGHHRRHWSLHRNLLCHHSDLLEAELEGDAHGSNRKDELDLTEYDAAGFELLVKWLYQGQLDDVSDMADASQKYDYAVSCYQLYLLCHRLHMSQLKNVAIDQYRKGLNEAALVPDADEIDDIYHGSPAGSPFKPLMVRIAARQIMDPASERDVDTYRPCFENSPDFAIDLIKAIKLGTGGTLLLDPTDPGNGCQYHDHEAAPHCTLKEKDKVKPVKKLLPHPSDRTSIKSTLSTNSDPPSPPRHPPPKRLLRLPPRPARPQDGTGAGPLRRSLTSPASSTVGTSKETAIALQPPSPHMKRERERDRERLRKATSPEIQQRQSAQNQAEAINTMPSRPVQDVYLSNSGDAPRHIQSNATVGIASNGVAEGVNQVQQTPSRRGLWEWADVWKGSMKTESSTPSFTSGDMLESSILSEPQDDYRTPSTAASQLRKGERETDVAAVSTERLGAPVIMSPSFSQTKRASDDLIAASSTSSTPANRTAKAGSVSSDEMEKPSATLHDSPSSTPDTPTPRQRKGGDASVSDSLSAAHSPPSKDTPPKRVKLHSEKESRDGVNVPTTATSIPHRVPKYKIALAPDLLSSVRHDFSTF